MRQRPYEIFIRINADGSIGSHYKTMETTDDGIDTGRESAPVSIAGLNSNAELLAEIQVLLPGLISVAESNEKLSEFDALKEKYQEERAAHAETKAELDELKAAIEAL